MKILKDYDLKNLNTFGISAKAKFFTEVGTEADLKEILESTEFKNNKRLFLGGGSNVLFTQDFDGIVILNKMNGIEILSEDSEFMHIQSMSGELWHDLVLFSVEKNLWGIENLSLVPGTVGGAPMQNIGAYGAELKETLESVEVFDIDTGEKKVFKNEECEFGYRDSIFKRREKGKYFITNIILKLSKKSNLNTSYKVLKDYLEQNKIEPKNSKDVSDAVSAIRRSKLPDPKILGNAGSFFKNVYVSIEKYTELLKEYPDMPSFRENGRTKIPAGWLVEHCGWKGKRVGATGVHDKQALVLVNHGGATGQEIKDLALQIIDSVLKKFDLDLVPEVNFV